MPFGDYGTYKTRPMLMRQDTDNRQFIYARALSGATFKNPYILLVAAGTTVGTGATGIGYLATAPFDTGCAASVSLMLGVGDYWYSIADEAVASGSDGWFQVGGPCISATLATVSATTGNYYQWAKASVSSFAATFAAVHSSIFAVAMTSNTGGLPAGSTAATYTCHDIYLLGRPCWGTT